MLTIIVIAIALGACVLGFAYAGGFEKRWDKTIHVIMTAVNSPFELREGPYCPGTIKLQSREYVQGFRLPYARSGTMPIIKSIWWQYSQPGRPSTPIGIISMEEGYKCVECKLSQNVLLLTEPESSLMITIWNPGDRKEVVFVMHPPSGPNLLA